MSGTMDDNTKNIVTSVGVGVFALLLLFAIWRVWRRKSMEEESFEDILNTSRRRSVSQ